MRFSLHFPFITEEILMQQQRHSLGTVIIVQDSNTGTRFWPLNLFRFGRGFWYCPSADWCLLKGKIFLFSLICQSVHLSSLCHHNIIKTNLKVVSEWKKKKACLKIPKRVVLMWLFLQFLTLIPDSKDDVGNLSCSGEKAQVVLKKNKN